MRNTQNYSLCMCTGSAQNANKHRLVGCITLAHTHTLAVAKASTVHKLPSYTLLNTLLTLLFTTCSIVLINSVKTILIPIVHRPYIQNNKLLLTNI